MHEGVHGIAQMQALQIVFSWFFASLRWEARLV